MNTACDLCRAPKSQRVCEECGKHACKNCLTFLEPGSFAFQPAPPAFAAKSAFCTDCFESAVAPALERYNEALERSHAVTLVRLGYRGHLPFLKKAKAPVEVNGIPDKNEAVAQLCFLAAWEGYDAIVQLETESRKVRNHGWEKKAWSARGLFACLDYKRFRPEESD